MRLIIGRDSEIGGAVCRSFKRRGLRSGIDFVGTSRRHRPFLDLNSDDWQWYIPEGTTSACICAAVTKLKTCEDDPWITWAVNVKNTLRLADKLRKFNIPTLFISSNHVFDGETPHVPPDAPHSPVSEYGKQKSEAEKGFSSILRLGKVISRNTPIIREWTEKLYRGEPIRAFTNLKMAPVEISEVVSAIDAIMGNDGIYQLTGPRDKSYFEYALELSPDPSLVIADEARKEDFPRGFIRRHTTLQRALL